MPKNRKVVKLGNNSHNLNVSSKFRIGTREDGKSAHFMPTADLKDVLSNKNKQRYVPSALAVLKLRGVSV